ncbi:MAG: heme-binding protein, partial [Planctomycetia bacterium]|nr:heme-binding protein [Planctomycetia bacterium]
MLLRCHKPFSFLAALAVLPALLYQNAQSAADGKFVTQKPEILNGGALPTAQPAKTAPSGEKDLFAQGPTPLWVWGADSKQRYVLRKEFAGGSSAAKLKATCDNQMTLYINGQQVAASGEWQSPVEVDIQKHLKSDKNVLLAEVTNTDGVAGFVLKLVQTMPDGAQRYVVSDETWQAADKKDAEKWVAVAKVGKLGDAPWGNVLAKNTAADAPKAAGNAFQTLPGFQVERLFTVPKAQMGSWVCITFDHKGRLIASDQGNQGLYRVTPPKIGSNEETKVEKLDVKMTAAQGMLDAFGSLYCSVNGGPGSGLYRLRDTNNDDQYDEVTKLKAFRGGGEHGPHGLRLSPDGKSIVVVAGNHTLPPEKLDASRIRSNWAEDLLLPRQWDANGHARGIMAPGGWIAQTDPEGKTWEMLSIGYRNAYDIAFNADGELFAYDSDMEWDMGSPWYRPTRVTHAVSGSEFGWRSGTGKWPEYYIDSLPPLLDIGPGSPVGVEFGYKTKFPAKYQKALYILDWTFGTIYAIHIEPDGASYKAVREEFVSRTPLPLTDAAVGPDGALYFTVGGRGTQSELFRVTYVGKEPTDPVDGKNKEGAELRALRQKLETYQTAVAEPAKAVEFLYPHLGHSDRFIRYAARVALEHIPTNLWQDRVLAEKEPMKLLEGVTALARQGDKALQPKLLAALDALDFSKLTEFQQLAVLRDYGLIFIRMGEPDKDTAARLAKKLDAYYPAKTNPLNRELANVLVYLKSPTVVAKTLALIQQETKPTAADSIAELLARNKGYGAPIAQMLANSADLQKYHLAFALRNLKEGWTMDQRKDYFKFVNSLRGKSGGSSYQGFINNMEKDAFDNCTDLERLTIEAAGLRKPFKVKELPKPQGPGRDWKLEDLVQYAEPKLMKG